MTDIKFICLLLVVLLSEPLAQAQLSDSQFQKIDSIIAKWDTPDSPGGVVGIMIRGELKFIKSFGLASLDFEIPNNDNTIFNIGSVSKQFTAMGIVRLCEEGKLSVDDDIRKYLPDLPDFGHVITIRHLLHHTSGLRDIHSLLAIAGWREEDPRSNEDLLRIMKDQQDLNFNPGDEYMYSNTGYILLAMIIETVTGESFINWMKNAIFIPLRLSNTYIENKPTRVVRGNATSYNAVKEIGFVRAVEYWNYYGSGNVHTTANDLLLWSSYFINPPQEWKTSFEILQTVDTLNNGKKNIYAYGLEIADYYGERRIQHGGSVGGFRSYACVFPNKQICIAMLTNFSSSQPEQKVNLISELVIPELLRDNKPQEKQKVEYPLIPNENLKKYTADYWCDASNVARKIYLKNDTLWFFRSEGKESPLLYLGNDEFIMFNTESRLKVKFIIDDHNSKTMLVGAGDPYNYYKLYKPVSVNTKYLSEFTGQFFSPELKTIYTFTLKKDTLIGYHPKYGDLKITVLKQDLFQSQKPLGTINFIRDNRKNIIGIRVAFERVKNFWLEKHN